MTIYFDDVPAFYDFSSSSMNPDPSLFGKLSRGGGGLFRPFSRAAQPEGIRILLCLGRREGRGTDSVEKLKFFLWLIWHKPRGPAGVPKGDVPEICLYGCMGKPRGNGVAFCTHHDQKEHHAEQRQTTCVPEVTWGEQETQTWTSVLSENAFINSL